mmetsp:Transcript_17721/g.26011  ORF Transcript_17721/g.26011 Transcript_17721/m.26011 type:complete len:409 (-) Transcript_17721:36-1262(-)
MSTAASALLPMASRSCAKIIGRSSSSSSSSVLVRKLWNSAKYQNGALSWNIVRASTTSTGTNLCSSTVPNSNNTIPNRNLSTSLNQITPSEDFSLGGDPLGIESRTSKSPLEELPANYTPGQALAVLRTKGAGGRFIRRTEFRDLCLASRVGSDKDAGVIVTALKEFKRINDHILVAWEARAAIAGLIRSKSKESGDDAEIGLEAALFVAKAIVDESTGLHLAAKTEDVDVVLQLLLDAVQSTTNHDDDYDDDYDYDDDDDDDDDDDKSVKPEDAMKEAKQIFALLVKRATRPEKNMKKRAARKYLKYAMTKEGPQVETQRIVSQICLKVGSPQDAKEAVLDVSKDYRWHLHQDTVKFIGDAIHKEHEEKERLRLANEQEEAEAAAAIDEAESDDVSEQNKEHESNKN